jgi:hypothetical protein
LDGGERIQPRASISRLRNGPRRPPESFQIILRLKRFLALRRNETLTPADACAMVKAQASKSNTF